MASQKTKSRARSSKGRSKEVAPRNAKAPQTGERQGRRASEKTGKYRFAQNVAGSGTAAEREYEEYALSDFEEGGGDPDVLLDVPALKVDSIHLEVDNLDAEVALRAKVLDLVTLNAGVDVHLDKLRIDIEGVEAQALLKVRLDRVAAIVDRVFTTIDRNPELVESLGSTVEEIGEGTGHALGETGEAVEDVGEGAEGAVEDVGSGAGQAVGEIGEGAGQAVGDVGQGAGQAVGDVGEGAGEAVGQLGQGAGEAAGGLLGGGGGNGGEGGLAGASASDVAKLAAKVVAEELKTSAKEEAKELAIAAARKARKVGERRKQNRAEELNATEAALRAAEELDVDLEGVEGSGPDRRITIRDVRQAQES
jgi:e3 binding domain